MVQNITLSAEGVLVRKAREKAQQERRSLNVLFRDWIRRYVGQENRTGTYRILMRRLKHIRAGRAFSREERNAR